ncbi:site-specific integrase [Mucilaginibacter sp. JRF]|uniref:site-specific integrase n=1 Tax=Mucilaginibacter sp. JRF TaxID=2780088 RepID=UPI00187E71B1|nr:site-specific integrase [Mucilaginibacter sp. JRF]MBE9585930.1 site-specific integrase [Mucilaginibacter sp. JRF]
MMRTVCVNFSLKKSKILSNGTAPVYMRLTIDKERVEFTTRRYIKPDRWNLNRQQMTGTNEEARTFNSYLKTLEQKVFEVQRQMIDGNVLITALGIRDELFGRADKNSDRMLVPIFADNNGKIRSLVGQEYASGTLERYETSLKHTVDFMQWKYGKRDIDISMIDHEFITSYDYYLRSVRRCANNSVVKYLKNFKKIIRICIANGWLDKDPFINYKAKIKEVKRDYLTIDEIRLIRNKNFKSERINQIRDIFLFSCFTGLAYADVKKLKRSEIVKGLDDQFWISTSRQKTDTASRIPLLPDAELILELYKDHPECLHKGYALPVLSNQKMNAYLKEIADICGITKELTYHMARHTFATSVTLANGVSIESVSKMLGHKNIRTTQHYAKVLDKKVSEDMAMLKVKLLSE